MTRLMKIPSSLSLYGVEPRPPAMERPKPLSARSKWIVSSFVVVLSPLLRPEVATEAADMEAVAVVVVEGETAPSPRSLDSSCFFKA